jgi:general secretion pathway protein J
MLLKKTLCRTKYLSSGFRAPAYGSTQTGFTLLEVLIAIGITAMIGLGSWQILNSAIRSSEATQSRLEELNALQKTMLIMSRDFQQLLPRAIRDEYGDYQKALTSKSEFYLIELSRAGWRNPLDDHRSNVQRVAYELDGNTLVRHYWSVLDRSQDSQSLARTLMDGVESVSFKFMNDSGGWLDEWPPSDASGTTPVDPRFNDNQFPSALSVIIKLERFGTITRLFDLVSYLPGKAFSSNTGGKQ